MVYSATIGARFIARRIVDKHVYLCAGSRASKIERVDQRSASFPQLVHEVHQLDQHQRQYTWQQKKNRGVRGNFHLRFKPRIHSLFLSYPLGLNCTSSSSSITMRLFSSGNKRDYYEVLGVAKGMDKGLIKKAYFMQAKKYHPDANKGDAAAAEKFKEVTEAYEILSDDKQRELYDNYGHAGVDPNSGFGENGPGVNPFGQGFKGFDFGDGSFHFQTSGQGAEIDAEDIFDAFFGDRRRKARGPRRGSDLQMHVRLSFMEAVFGTNKKLHLKYQVKNSQTGKMEIKERDVTVDIPVGIENGSNFRVTGQGAEGDSGAPKGNLLVTVIVEEDTENYFQRDGFDVHVEIPISVTHAILGGMVDVKTLTGVVEMKIPMGCQPDSKLVMRGKGIPYFNGREKGDQIVHLKIKIPKNTTPRQVELLREFEKESDLAGYGISRRLAKAAGSAFDNLFRGNKPTEKTKVNQQNTFSKVKKCVSKDHNNDVQGKKSMLY